MAIINGKGGKENTNSFSLSSTTNKPKSSIISYGSYSGCDIKVVVNVPRNQKKIEEINFEIDSVKEDIEFDQVDANRYEGLAALTLPEIQRSSPGITSQSQVSERLRAAKESLSVNQNRLNSLNKELSDINAAPTTIALGDLQTISYSLFRDKKQIRSLGAVYPRSVVRGNRTIAGTMVFSIFHKHAMHQILETDLTNYSTGVDFDKYKYTTNLMDQLPPLDISIIFANEYGAFSYMGLYGVEFFQEGATFSIEDVFSENVVQFIARDIDPMRDIDKRVVDDGGVTKQWTKTASQLAEEEKRLTAYRIRRNPFI